MKEWGSVRCMSVMRSYLSQGREQLPENVDGALVAFGDLSILVRQ